MQLLLLYMHYYVIIVIMIYKNAVLDHREFRERATGFFDTYDQIVERSVVRVVPDALGARGIQLCIADGRRSLDDPTFIVPKAYMAFENDGFEDQRDAVLATELKARVIGVDTPGVSLSPSGHEKAKVPLGFKMDALQGDVSRYAAAQLNAIKHVLGEDEYNRTPMHLLGYSMAAWLIANMVNLENAPKVAGMHIVEGVNDQKYRLSKLVRNISREDAYTDRYLAHNQENGYEFRQPPDRQEDDFREKQKPQDQQHRPVIVSGLLGVGMRKPFIPTLIEAIEKDKLSQDPNGISKSTIDIYRADGSVAARRGANVQTTEQLARAGVDVTMTELTDPRHNEQHHHPIWHSMPSVAIFASQFLKPAR